MKRKAVGFIFALLMFAVFLYGCGGGGGSHSNPAAPNSTGLARVSGKIVDSAKKPVADVKVRLALTTNSLVNSLPNEIKNTLRLSTTDNSTEFNTTTDKDGQYRFENVPYGRYSLSARASDNGSGVLATDLYISGTDTTLSDEPLKPFGFVTGTVFTKNDEPIYGARVYISDNEGNPITINENGYTSFTNSDGAFTLSYIPIETPSSFTASLEGYEPVIASFTIAATETELIHNCKPIILNPDSSEAHFSVSATITGIDKVAKPIYVIAQNTDNPNILCYGKFERDDSSISTIDIGLIIGVAGEYNVFAVSSDSKKSTIGKHDTSSSDKTVKLEFSDSSSEPEPKTVVIKKIEINPIFDESPITYQSDTLNKYGDCVSCLDSFGSLFYTTLDGIDRKEEWKEVSLNSGGTICGSSAVCLSSDVGSIWYTKDGDESFITIPLGDKVSNINHLALYPNDYISVAFDYNCAGTSYYYVDTYGPLEEGSVSDIPFKKQERDYRYWTSSTETCPAYALRMAKGNDGNCYLAALYSDHGLRIYNVSTSNESDYVAFEDNSVGNDLWTITNFQVLNDSNGNILFYIEEERNSDNKVYAYLINKSAKTNVSDSNSTRKSCYIDQKGNMYRYDSSEATTTNTTGHKIIKISSSSPTLDGTATAVTPAEGSDTNEDINGVLGFEEDADKVTIFVY